MRPARRSEGRFDRPASLHRSAKPRWTKVTFDGEVYGIPEFDVVQIVQADADLPAAAGLTVEDVEGSDRDALRAADQALARAEGGGLSVIGFDNKLP